MIKHLTRQLKKLRGFRLGRVNVRKEARSQSRLRNNLEKTGFKRITSLMLKFGRKQAKDISVNGTFNRELASREFQQELRPVLTAHYRRIYQSIYEQNESRYGNSIKGLEANVFGINQDIEDLVLLHVRSRESLITNISDRTANDIDNILSRGREEGLTPNQMGKFINKEFPSIGRRRANTIARTETHNAASTANHQYHETLGDQLGIGLNKRWVATSDARTRSIHSAANGQTVAMDEDFIVGGAPMKHAGDPRGGARNNVNCRCVIVYVDDPEAVVDDSPFQQDPKISRTVENVQIGQDGRILNKTTEKDTLARLATATPIASIKNKYKTNRDASEWDDIGHQTPRYNGSSVNTLNNPNLNNLTTAYAKKNNIDPDDLKKVAVIIEDTMPELNALAKEFDVPPLRSQIAARKNSRYTAAMGDATLFVQSEIMSKLAKSKGLSQDAVNTIQGVKGARKPHNVDEYLETGTDKVKSVLYHEFAHHIHQMKAIKTNKQMRELNWSKVETMPPAEQELKKLKGGRRKGVRNNSPSRYGMKNEYEWFTENFALWQYGKGELCDPDFLTYIQTLRVKQ